jgi:threonine/homoserine/homoserine lactone efflux protein
MGLRQTLPLIAGIDITYVVFSLLIGLGLGELFKAWLVLKYSGGGYLIYLSHKIWNLRPGEAKEISTAMGLKDGVILTICIPKPIYW